MRIRTALAGLFVCILVANADTTPAPIGRFYAWANPLSGVLHFADHTWVTDYGVRPVCPKPQSAYWYSTGSCHPSGKDPDPRPLAEAPGDEIVAHCIAEPNVSTFKPGPPTAEIVYGIDGVCHQICNRILAATAIAASKQITVEKAHGYRISRFVYGTHGTPDQWRRLRDKCNAAHALALSTDQDLSAMISEAFGVQLGARKVSALRGEQERLRGAIREFAKSAASGRDFAERVNNEINASLRRLEETLGKEDFERFFRWRAGEPIVLVDPQIASEMKYK